MNTAAVIRCEECDVPYILRHTLRLDGSPPCFAYYADCRCRRRRRTKAEGPPPDRYVERDDDGAVVRVQVMSDE